MIPENLVAGVIDSTAPLARPTLMVVDSYFAALLRVEQAQKEMEERLAREEDCRP